MSFHTRINLDFFSWNLKKNEIQEKIWFFKGLRQFKRNFIRSTLFLLRDVSFNRNFKVIKRIFGLKMPNVKDSKKCLQSNLYLIKYQIIHQVKKFAKRTNFELSAINQGHSKPETDLM